VRELGEDPAANRRRAPAPARGRPDRSSLRLTLARADELLADVKRAVGRWRAAGRALRMSVAELDAFAPAFEHVAWPRPGRRR
jgi:hypothetical protein